MCDAFRKWLGRHCNSLCNALVCDVFTTKNGKEIQVLNPFSLISHSLHPLIRYNFLILGLLLFVGSKQAQALTIFMESSLGFADTFRVKTWTPLAIVVENRGKLLEGMLEVVVRSGNEYKNNMEEVAYQKPVQLPAHSRKKYNFTVYIRSSVHPLTINLYQNGTLVHSESLLLQPLVSEKKIALFLGERGNSSFLNEIAQEVQPLFVRAATLPYIWYGYEGVDLVMVQSAILKSLKNQQFQALVQWVENGGFLILNGGLDYSFFADRAMKRLATIRVLGLERRRQLQALKPFAEKTFRTSHPFLVLNARIGGGRTLLREGRLPLVTEKPVGAGKVLFLAFDFQSSLLQGWGGNLNFWHWLNRFRPAKNPSLLGLSEKDLLSNVMAAISYRFPNYYFILALLVGYAVVTRILFNRLQNRVEKQTLTLLFATFFFFSLASVGIYTHQQASTPQQSQFTLLTKHARSPLAFGQQWTAIYSFQADLLQIENTEERPPFRLLEAKYVKNITEERFIQQENQANRQVTIPTRRWSHQYLATQFSTPLPLVGWFEEKRGHLKLVIENKTAFALKNGLIYWSQRFIPIGELPAHKRKTIELHQAQIQEHPVLQREILQEVAESLEPAFLTSHLDRFRKGLMSHLLDAFLRNYAPQKDRLLLLGWLETEGLPETKPSAVRVQDRVTLLEWEILSR